MWLYCSLANQSPIVGFWVISSVSEDSTTMNSFVPTLFALASVCGIESWTCHCWIKCAHVIWLNNATHVSILLHPFCVLTNHPRKCDLHFLFLLSINLHLLLIFLWWMGVKLFLYPSRLPYGFTYFIFLFKLRWLIGFSIIKQDLHSWDKPTLIKIHYI